MRELNKGELNEVSGAGVISDVGLYFGAKVGVVASVLTLGLLGNVTETAASWGKEAGAAIENAICGAFGWFSSLFNR